MSTIDQNKMKEGKDAAVWERRALLALIGRGKVDWDAVVTQAKGSPAAARLPLRAVLKAFGLSARQANIIAGHVEARTKRRTNLGWVVKDERRIQAVSDHLSGSIGSLPWTAYPFHGPPLGHEGIA